MVEKICERCGGKEFKEDGSCKSCRIVPLALGGQNEDRNIQLLRAECNNKKNAKHPVEYMRSKGFLL